MSTIKDAKQALVDEIKQKLEKAKTVVFVDYRGMTVAADTKMRANFRANGAEYHVYKNRLMLRALNELGYTGCENYLEGTSAVAFGFEDEIAPAKIVVDSKNEKCEFNIKFGIYNKQVVTADEIKKLASIPSREVLLSRLFGSMQSPIANLARVLDQIAEKGGAGAPAEEVVEVVEAVEAEVEAPAAE